MKYEVKLYVGGKVFTEEVQAANYQDAKETATARNPKAKVIGVNPVFRWMLFHPATIQVTIAILLAYIILRELSQWTEGGSPKASP